MCNIHAPGGSGWNFTSAQKAIASSSCVKYQYKNASPVLQCIGGQDTCEQKDWGMCRCDGSGGGVVSGQGKSCTAPLTSKTECQDIYTEPGASKATVDLYTGSGASQCGCAAGYYTASGSSAKVCGTKAFQCTTIYNAKTPANPAKFPKQALKTSLDNYSTTCDCKDAKATFTKGTTPSCSCGEYEWRTQSTQSGTQATGKWKPGPLTHDGKYKPVHGRDLNSSMPTCPTESYTSFVTPRVQQKYDSQERSQVLECVDGTVGSMGFDTTKGTFDCTQSKCSIQEATGFSTFKALQQAYKDHPKKAEQTCGDKTEARCLADYCQLISDRTKCEVTCQIPQNLKLGKCKWGESFGTCTYQPP